MTDEYTGPKEPWRDYDAPDVELNFDDDDGFDLSGGDDRPTPGTVIKAFHPQTMGGMYNCVVQPHPENSDHVRVKFTNMVGLHTLPLNHLEGFTQLP